MPYYEDFNDDDIYEPLEDEIDDDEMNEEEIEIILKKLIDYDKERKKLFILNPGKVKKVYIIHNKLKKILDLFDAEYTIKIAEQNEFMPKAINYIINTNTFGATVENIKMFRQFINEIDEIEILSGINNTICILIGINDAFIEIESPESE